jgi:dipeptidase E
MKILLSSDGKAAIKGMQDIVPYTKGLKVLWVITAAKGKSNISYLDWDLQFLLEAGCEPTIYDISGKTEDQILRDIQNIDLIFVEGGNVFYLLSEVKRSGFDKILTDWIKTKPYVGVSAGSYIMQPSIEIATWYHPKEEWEFLNNFNAINAIECYFLVHSQKKDTSKITERAKQEGKEVVLVNDGEALLVENSKYSKKKYV